MDFQTLLEWFRAFAYLVLGGLAIYFKYSSDAQKMAKQVQTILAEIAAKAVVFIKEAEENYKDATNAGGQKFAEVVDKLHSLVPDALKLFITKEMIADIVQSTFDEIENYVKLQLDETIKNVKIKEEEM